MATQNNLHVPDDLLAEARRLAEEKGSTADDLAAAALKRYITHERLDELGRFGREHSRLLEIDTLSKTSNSPTLTA
jgi:hypothetical protein